MNLIVKLGWRNIWRNKRRTILTILAISFATFLTVISRGIANGTWEYNIKNTLELFSGYIQIQRTGFKDSPSLHKSFTYPGSVESILQEDPSISGYAPRIISDGLLSFKENSAGAAIFGIDIQREQKISRFHERIKAGRMFHTDSLNEIVLGYKLLNNLKANVGDTIVILAQGFDGVLGNQLYKITGTVSFGTQDFDRVVVLMNLRGAQELLAMEGRVNIVAVMLSDFHQIDEAQAIMSKNITDAGLTNLSVLNWGEVIPELQQAREFDLIGDYFFLGVLLIVITFGILNTVLMSVTERFREFGITLAMGMQSKDLVKLVLMELTFIALIGILAGSIFGYGVNFYLETHPIIMTGEFGQMYEDYGFIPQLVSTSRLSYTVRVMIIILGLSIFSSIYPAYKVYKLEPLKGIRQT
ncbi:MAG: FtsX-like permease family protein [bacterium]